MGNPRVPVTEGEPPNTVEDVVGEVGGAAYFSDCCEPIAGQVRTATAPETVEAGGVRNVIGAQPYRTRLATLNSFGLEVVDLTVGKFTYRNFDTSGAPTHPWDLVWSADDSQLIMIFFDEHGGGLKLFAASGALDPGRAVAQTQRRGGFPVAPWRPPLTPDPFSALEGTRTPYLLIRSQRRMPHTSER